MKKYLLLRMMIWTWVGLILVGCIGGDATPTLNPTEGAQMLAGIYTLTLTEEDLAEFYSLDPNLPDLQGEWQITLFNDGKYEAVGNGQWVGSGDYTVKGSEISIYVASVCDDCPCLQSIGRYNWALKDEQLLMAKKAGTCDLMHAVFTTHPLVRQP
jgi:hypothetical protein